MTLQVVEGKEGCTFRVRIVPRSRQDQVDGVHGDALKLRLTAPPERGKANRALSKFLAERLGVSPSDVEILSGHTSRRKRVHVRGISASAIRDLVSGE